MHHKRVLDPHGRTLMCRRVREAGWTCSQRRTCGRLFGTDQLSVDGPLGLGRGYDGPVVGRPVGAGSDEQRVATVIPHPGLLISAW